MSDSYDPMDCTLPGSSAHGIFQARIQEWVAISFSRGPGINLGIKSGSPELQSDSFIFFLQADSLPAMSDLQLIEHQLCRA